MGSTGFDRLRGVAVISAAGLGLLGAGSGRAATVTTRTNVTINTGATGWSSIGNLNAVMGDQSITTTAGFALTSAQTGFGISDAFSLSAPIFYDGGMSFAVGGSLFANPDNTVDLTGTTLTTDVAINIVPGIDARIQYYFNPVRPVVRGLFSLTNVTSAPISTSALVMGNYDSDANTTIQATSDGDTTVEDSDLWIVSDDTGVQDPNSDGGDATATTTSHGTGALVVPVTSIALGIPAGGVTGAIDNYGYRYDLTIPANETVHILVFNEMNDTVPDAIAEAADFESLAAANSAGLLTGLTTAELTQIVNYGPEPTLQDTDGDGVLDANDAFPNDPTETTDTDGDGVGDNADAFPNDPDETADSDGDGVGDNADFFPNDPNLTVPPDDDDGFLGIGSFSLPGMASLLGLLAVFRLGRRKD